MRDRAESLDVPASTSSHEPARPAPGRVTLTSRLVSGIRTAEPVPPRAAVQRRDAVAAPAIDPFAVHRLADGGVAGASAPLPYLDDLKQSFGRHGAALDGVRAQIGGPAAEATAAIGATAYATGDRVAFASAPDRALVAHEAAHVVQQQAGVSLKGGVGAAGDPYEQHADEVAAAFARGESAEPILDRMPSGGGGGAIVQRKDAAPIDPAMIRKRLLDARYQAQAAAADVAHASAGRGASTRVEAGLGVLLAAAIEVSPMLGMIAPTDKHELVPVAQGCVVAGNRLDPTGSSKLFWAMYQCLDQAMGGGLVPAGGVGAEPAGDERHTHIDEAFAAAKDALQSPAGIATALGRLAVLRELLRGASRDELDALAPRVKELGAAITELDRQFVDQADDRMTELKVRYSDVAQLVGLGRVSETRMAAIVNGENDRVRAHSKDQLAEWSATAKSIVHNIDGIYRERKNAVDSVKSVAEAEDPPHTPIWETLAVMALEAAGGAVLGFVLNKLTTAVKGKLDGVVAKRQGAIDDAVAFQDGAAADALQKQKLVTDLAVKGAKALLDKGKDAGVAKGKQLIGTAVKGGAPAPAPGAEDPKTAFFSRQTTQLDAEWKQADKDGDAMEASLAPLFAEVPAAALAQLKALATALDVTPPYALEEQKRQTRARYVEMIAQSSLGTVPGNAQRPAAAEGHGILGDPTALGLGSLAKVDVNPWDLVAGKQGTDMHKTLGVGILGAQGIAGVVMIAFDPRDATDHVKVKRAWIKGLKNHWQRNALQEMPLAPYGIPFHAVGFAPGGTLSFSRNERGEIWYDVSDGFWQEWCEKKVGSKDGAKEKAARKILEEEIGRWTLKAFHGVELEDG